MKKKYGLNSSQSRGCDCSRGSWKIVFSFVKMNRFDLKVLERG